MLEIIGAPFDYCGFRPGSRLGPAAVRLAGLTDVLGEIGIDVIDSGDIEVLPEHTAVGGIKNFQPAIQAYKDLRSRVEGAIDRGNIPLMLGGDHSLAIGSVSGALSKVGDSLAVLWIDAHVDVNTPATSPSGNLHGMSLGALQGLSSSHSPVTDTEWKRLLTEVVPASKLKSERTAWYAVRDVDGGEKKTLQSLPKEYMATMYDVDRYSAVEMILRFDQWMRDSGATHLWISFDVDSLDPILAPGTGTAVRGGLSYREMHVIGELLHELLSAKDCPYKLVGLDLVETNPLFDTNNETARTAVEWIASLFGKTILGSR